MKKIFIILLLMASFACKNTTSNRGVIKYKTQGSTAVNDSLYIKTKGLLICDKNFIKGIKLQKGDTLRHKFLFVNEGEEQVEIMGYTTSCNCNKITVTKNILQPKDSAFVEMVMNTNNKLIGITLRKRVFIF